MHTENWTVSGVCILTRRHQSGSMDLRKSWKRISWSMPTYWHGVNIIHFAANKNGIGLYPGTEAINNFKDELTSYKTTKSSIEIPYGHIDEDLIRRITIFCWKEILFL